MASPAAAAIGLPLRVPTCEMKCVPAVTRVGSKCAISSSRPDDRGQGEAAADDLARRRRESGVTP